LVSVALVVLSAPQAATHTSAIAPSKSLRSDPTTSFGKTGSLLARSAPVP
jgi:hypothetical protein